MFGRGRGLGLLGLRDLELSGSFARRNHGLVSCDAIGTVLIFKNNYFTEMCSGSEEGSYLRRIDFFITQL